MPRQKRMIVDDQYCSFIILSRQRRRCIHVEPPQTVNKKMRIGWRYLDGERQEWRISGVLVLYQVDNGDVAVKKN